MTAPRWQDVVIPLVRNERARLEEHLAWTRQLPVAAETARVFRERESARIEARIAPLDAALARLAEPETAGVCCRPRADGAFVCCRCQRLACWSRGAADDMPGACDDCWSKAHALDDPLLDTAQTSDADAAEACRAVGVDPVALGERAAAFVASLPARAPTAAERWRAVPADVRRIVLRWVERGQAQAHRDNVDAYHALVALAREAEGGGR